MLHSLLEALCISLLLIFSGDSQLEYLFHIYLTCSNSHLRIENSTLIFENNHILRGRIFQIEGGKSIILSSVIMLTNNACQNKDSDALWSTVLMLQATEMVEIIDTKLLFLNNSASQLSGGITMIKGSKIYCVHCKLEFFENRGVVMEEQLASMESHKSVLPNKHVCA